MIPLSVPNMSGNEWKYVKECLDTNWISSVGSYVNLFEKKTTEFCGCRFAVATSNGTAALHTCMLLAGVKTNDLVILPNITFVAPANAIKYVNADPILLDVDPYSWQMDLDVLERFLAQETTIKSGQCIHKKTTRVIRAILPVHILGNMCDMDRLLELGKKSNLVVIEDATEALGSFYKGRHAGTFGQFGCLSYNGNKIISTGGGGMILTNDEEGARKAKHLTTQAKASQQEYFHDQVGYNYRLVNVLAAIGVAQMEQLPTFLKRKKEIANEYNQSLNAIRGLHSQKMAADVQSNSWLYTINVKEQTSLREHLLTNNVETRPLWVPINNLPAFKDDIYYHFDDVSADVYRQCLSLPCSTNLTSSDQKRVIELILKFYKA